jgi:hypothetical protein
MVDYHRHENRQCKEVRKMKSRKIKYLKTIDIITGTLLVIGGLNWGLIGFFGFDLVGALFGTMSVVSRIIYGLVGISALYEVAMMKSIWHRWECSSFSSGSEHPAT